MTKQKPKRKFTKNQLKRGKNAGKEIDRRYMKNSPLRYIRKRSAQKHGLEAIRELIYIMRNHTTAPELKIKVATILLENAKYHTKLNRTMPEGEREMKLVKGLNKTVINLQAKNKALPTSKDQIAHNPSAASLDTLPEQAKKLYKGR